MPGIDTIRNARVSINHKRDLLDLVWQKAGPDVLLNIGQGIRDIGYDPIWHGAIQAAEPEVVFEKWRRFEKFGHSRNRLRIIHNGENFAPFERYSTHKKTPTAPENLLICGLMIAILEINGCKGLCCDMRLRDGSMHPLRKEAQFFLPEDVTKLDTGRWEISWRTHSPAPDKLLSDQCLPEMTLPEMPLPGSSNATLRSWVHSIIKILMLDVSRQWKVEILARQAGLSKRSFQRRMREAELSFSQLVRLVRIHEACRLLKQPGIAITTIGFCAGFTDSAHFSRDFHASMGMTPSQYRTVW